MTKRKTAESADGPRVQTNVTVVAQKHIMLSPHVVCKIVTDYVLVSAQAAAKCRLFPFMTQIIMRRLRLEHITTARRAEPRRR